MGIWPYYINALLYGDYANEANWHTRTEVHGIVTHWLSAYIHNMFLDCQEWAPASLYSLTKSAPDPSILGVFLLHSYEVTLTCRDFFLFYSSYTGWGFSYS